MNRLKVLREEKKLLQSDIARIIGITPQAIGLYENEKRDIPTSVLVQLADYFNVSTDYILGITSYKNPKEDLEKSLYELNLSEDEFNEMISLLLDEDNDNIDNVLQTSSKLAIACEKCLNLIMDYGQDDSNNLYKHIPKLTNLIKTLDKNKIIHNHQNHININNKFYMCPVYGQISAGQPNWAEECIEGRIPIDYELMNIVNPEEHFFLRVNRRKYE